MKIKKITIENALSFGEGDDKLDIHLNGQITSIRSQDTYTAQKTQTLSARSGLKRGMEDRQGVNRSYEISRNGMQDQSIARFWKKVNSI